jgi:hypothetical protein
VLMDNYSCGSKNLLRKFPPTLNRRESVNISLR